MFGHNPKGLKILSIISWSSIKPIIRMGPRHGGITEALEIQGQGIISTGKMLLEGAPVMGDGAEAVDKEKGTGMALLVLPVFEGDTPLVEEFLVGG